MPVSKKTPPLTMRLFKVDEDGAYAILPPNQPLPGSGLCLHRVTVEKGRVKEVSTRVFRAEDVVTCKSRGQVAEIEGVKVKIGQKLEDIDPGDNPAMKEFLAAFKSRG